VGFVMQDCVLIMVFQKKNDVLDIIGVKFGPNSCEACKTGKDSDDCSSNHEHHKIDK
jgi:hypothetical protein